MEEFALIKPLFAPKAAFSPYPLDDSILTPFLFDEYVDDPSARIISASKTSSKDYIVGTCKDLFPVGHSGTIPQKIRPALVCRQAFLMVRTQYREFTKFLRTNADSTEIPIEEIKYFKKLAVPRYFEDVVTCLHREDISSERNRFDCKKYSSTPMMNFGLAKKYLFSIIHDLEIQGVKSELLLRIYEFLCLKSPAEGDDTLFKKSYPKVLEMYNSAAIYAINKDKEGDQNQPSGIGDGKRRTAGTPSPSRTHSHSGLLPPCPQDDVFQDSSTPGVLYFSPLIMSTCIVRSICLNNLVEFNSLVESVSTGVLSKTLLGTSKLVHFIIDMCSQFIANDYDSFLSNFFSPIDDVIIRPTGVMYYYLYNLVTLARKRIIGSLCQSLRSQFVSVLPLQIIVKILFFKQQSMALMKYNPKPVSSFTYTRQFLLAEGKILRDDIIIKPGRERSVNLSKRAIERLAELYKE
ncbi:hypothetical protein ADUPG1_013574 [Aduncisulcus paluster]|uniref:Uncharacterized protein n=1 Tax=Aduncisulcus paluster TaxID=2918883 RepID=A0ABQ5K3E7_9EUKA|nr:hypothetical protein ADUPG1_013574 [Aduncisulcus paluster]